MNVNPVHVKVTRVRNSMLEFVAQGCKDILQWWRDHNQWSCRK